MEKMRMDRSKLVTYITRSDRDHMSDPSAWHFIADQQRAELQRTLPSVRGASVTETATLTWDTTLRHSALRVQQTLTRPFRDPQHANHFWEQLIDHTRQRPINLWNGQRVNFMLRDGSFCQTDYTVHKTRIHAREFATRATIATTCRSPTGHFRETPSALLSVTSPNALTTVLETKSNALMSLLKEF